VVVLEGTVGQAGIGLDKKFSMGRFFEDPQHLVAAALYFVGHFLNLYYKTVSFKLFDQGVNMG
jgi:hypothetical protein